MQVRVDESRCEAYGVCAVDAPEIFELDEDGFAQVAVADVPAEMVDVAKRAVVSCPMRAILASGE